MSVEQGGGGGRAGADRNTALSDLSVPQPFELEWPLTPGSVEALNEMFRLLFKHSIGDINTARLLGRTSSGKGRVEEVSIGTGLSLLSGILSATSTGISLTASDYGVARITLTDAILNAGTTTQVVAAAGAGTIIVPLMWAWQVNISVAFGLNQGGTLQWATGPTTVSTMSNLVTIAATGKRFLSGSSALAAITTSNITNCDLQVGFSSSGGVGSSAAGGALLIVPYVVLTGLA